MQLEVPPNAGTTDSAAQAEEGIARRGRGRPRGSGRKPPNGAAANAKKLKTVGIAGRFAGRPTPSHPHLATLT